MFYKEATESLLPDEGTTIIPFCPLCHVRMQQEDAILETESSPHQTPDLLALSPSTSLNCDK
jgi:hypothetical protein